MTQPEGSPPLGSPNRLAALDALRGVAVVVMVLWHTADGWLAAELRPTRLFAWIEMFGGLAAPIFLLLAGAAAALRLESSANRGHVQHCTEPRPARLERDALRGLVARGASIVVLGYTLRFQFWLVDSGGIADPFGVLVLLGVGAGVAASLVGWARVGRGQRSGLLLAAAGVALIALAWLGVEAVSPRRALAVLRVDVLQAIGLSLMITAPLVVALRKRPLVLALLAATLAALAIPLANVLPGSLPPALAAYVAPFVPAPGQPNVALFPLCPWLAYTLVGALFATPAMRELAALAARRPWLLVAAGSAIAITFHEQVLLGRVIVGAAPPILSLVRLIYRVGAIGVLLGLCTTMTARIPALVTLGRASLLLYWIHLPFAFGIPSRPVSHALSFVEWAILAAVLITLCFWVAVVRVDETVRARIVPAGWRLSRTRRLS